MRVKQQMRQEKNKLNGQCVLQKISQSEDTLSPFCIKLNYIFLFLFLFKTFFATILNHYFNYADLIVLYIVHFMQL